MKIKPLASGKSIADNNVFIAPMAGYTDHAVRSLLIKLGAGLTFTELVSAKGLFYGAKGTKELLYAGEDNSDKAFAKEELKKTAAQIFGADPYYMRCACESEDLKKPLSAVTSSVALCAFPLCWSQRIESSVL